MEQSRSSQVPPTDEENRIPEQKRQTKEQQRKKNITMAAVLCICLAFFGGLFLIFSSESAPPQEPSQTNPYDGVYSYLSGLTAENRETAAQYPSSAGTVPPLSPSGETPSPAPSYSQDQTTAASTGKENDATLPATLPAPNGTMHVDTNTNNKFIQIVHQQYGISEQLLTAVYALPDTGQNYVLEWTGEKDAGGKLIRSADTLRRCFLIDTAGKVTAVAASDSGERENMSLAENRLAMETLIKRVILPKIEEELNR